MNYPEVRWQQGPRVKVSDLNEGDRFFDIEGNVRTKVGVDPDFSGAIRCLREDGSVTTYCANAEVVRL